MVMESGKRVISGTFGEVWLDGEIVAECTALQAKLTFNKEDVLICGQMEVDTKVMSVKGAGSLTTHKVFTRMGQLLSDKITNGKDVRFTIVSKLADPDAYGAERVSFSNVSFDDLTIMDWAAGRKGEITAPFTYTKHRYLNMIRVA